MRGSLIQSMHEGSLRGSGTFLPQGPFILVVEDDAQIERQIRRALLGHGFTSYSTIARAAISEAIASSRCISVLLDIGLPNDDGISIARLIRESSNVPIIMLTGRTGVRDRITGLNAGADDYVTKPFSGDELIARIRAILRRASPSSTNGACATDLLIGSARIDIRTHNLMGAYGQCHLTGHELRLLRAIGSAPGPLDRTEAYLTIFGREWDPQDRSLDVHVANLRRKLRVACGDTVTIATARGRGYELIVAPAANGANGH